MDDKVIGLDWLFDIFREMRCDIHGCRELATHTARGVSTWNDTPRSWLLCSEHTICGMRVGKLFYRLKDINPIP